MKWYGRSSYHNVWNIYFFICLTHPFLLKVPISECHLGIPIFLKWKCNSKFLIFYFFHLCNCIRLCLYFQILNFRVNYLLGPQNITYSFHLPKDLCKVLYSGKWCQSLFFVVFVKCSMYNRLSVTCCFLPLQM